MSSSGSSSNAVTASAAAGSQSSIESRSAAWSEMQKTSLAQTGGATVDPMICDAFGAQHAWTQNYRTGVERLGGEKMRILAIAPIGANHAQILAGGQTLARGFTLAETNIGGFPQVAFLRGDCAALITEFWEKGSAQRFTFGIRNGWRPAVSRASVKVDGKEVESGLLEALAGMIDKVNKLASSSSGKFVFPSTGPLSVMLKEIEEETGGALKLDPSQLVNLSEWQNNKRKGLSSFRPGDERTTANPLTPGGSDEHVHLFGCAVELPVGSIKKLHGAQGGEASEGESTLVQVIPIEEAPFMFADVKWLAGHNLLQLYMKEQAAAPAAGGGGSC